ncbi:MAG: hypothetical protein HC836_10525 [Richelia sp. RM2_1_2]|nr:hypothetical protein [Richelia sp. RM2_1_2]
MTKFTRSFSNLITSDIVNRIADELNSLGLPVIDIAEEHGEVVFTAMSETGLVLGTTNYIPNATGGGRDIIFGSRSGVFTAADVHGILCGIRGRV